MNRALALIPGLGVAALGWVVCDTTTARVIWAVAAIAVTVLLIAAKPGSAREHTLRLGITLVLIVSTFVATMLGDDTPQLGLDLQGGVSIVLFPVEGSDLSQLSTAVDVISSRVAGLGVSEPEVSRQGNTIVVDIPGLKDPQRAVEVVGRTACLRFRLVTAGPIEADAVTEPTTTATSTTAPASTTTVAGSTTTAPGGATSSSAAPTTAAASSTSGSADAAGVTLDTVAVVAQRPAQESTTTTAASVSSAPSSAATSTSGPDATTTTAPAEPKLNCDAADAVPTPEISLPPDLTAPVTPSSDGAEIVPGDTTVAPVPTGGATESSAEAAGHTIATTPVVAARPAQESTTTTTAGGTTTTTAGGTTTTTAGATSTTTAGSTTSTTTGATTTTLPVGSNLCKALVGEDDPNGTVWLYDKDLASCYQVGPTIMTGRSIGGADSRFEQNTGWLISVQFDDDDFVNNIATQYVGERVAIVLDDKVQSAPTINEDITGRAVQITGDFTEGEADNLALVLRYGSLPIQFDESETTQQTVSPSLGKDQLRAGIAAGVIGLILVALYMVFFYRLLGLVVWFGLALTAMIFFSLVTFLGNSEQFGLSLTLAGVTGLIVSVGVTVDSYVVYFERLKDEVRAGKTIRSSLDSGFRRAFRTIVAADLVSLIGAGVLYLLAIGSVRGFAFFLGLSTIIDLFIAYFVMYPLVWFLARRPSLVRMKGMGIAAGLDVAGKVDV